MLVLKRTCWNKIQKHLSSSDFELGGVIIGKVFDLKFKNKNVVHLEDIVPSKKFENSSVSLKMDSTIWNDANSCLSSKQAVVGWYHSHPNLGVFFSATDRYNQKASFSASWSTEAAGSPPTMSLISAAARRLSRTCNSSASCASSAALCSIPRSSNGDEALVASIDP